MSTVIFQCLRCGYRWSRTTRQRRCIKETTLVIRLYHGGLLDRSLGSLWATPDVDWAAAFAQLYEDALWMIALDVSDGEVLDLDGLRS